MAARGTPHQQHNLHAIAGDVLGQRSPDETGSAAHQKLPRHIKSAQRIGCDGKLAVAFDAASIFDTFLRGRFFRRQRAASLLLYKTAVQGDPPFPGS
jgi:hypothetical protein